MFLLKYVCFREKVLPKDLAKKDYKQHPIFNTNMGGGVILPPSSWFSLNNSKTVKAVTLAFWSI